MKKTAKMSRQPSPSFKKESGCQRQVFEFFDRNNFGIVNFILNFFLPVWPSSQVWPHQALREWSISDHVFAGSLNLTTKGSSTLLKPRLCHQQQSMMPKQYGKHLNRWICLVDNLDGWYQADKQTRLPDWNSQHVYQYSQIENHRIHQPMHKVLKWFSGW